MLESRWLRWVGPGVIALGAAVGIASTTVGVGDRPWAPRACDGPPSPADRTGPTDPPAAPLVRLDPILDPDGALTGQRLSIVLDGEILARTRELPPESFAAGPFGTVVLVGSDDGSSSRLEAIDVARRCSWPIADEPSVIRRATIDPAGASVYETRVDRADRTDLGVWRRPLDGTGPARRVLAPLAADARFGRTFSTEFTWDTAGTRLAVQACGEVACRTRVVEPDGAQGSTLDAPDLGPLVGFHGDRVVTYAACRGLPCPIVATDLRTGRREMLARDGGAAVLLVTTDGPTLVHETFDVNGARLLSVPLDGRAPADLGLLPAGLRLRTASGGSVGSARLPAGAFLLVPDDAGSAGIRALRPQLRHLPDGLTVPFDEAAR